MRAPRPSLPAAAQAHHAWKKGIDDPKGTTAYVFDEEADVLFMVNLMSENKAAAQKLVETLAKKP